MNFVEDFCPFCEKHLIADTENNFKCLGPKTEIKHSYGFYKAFNLRPQLETFYIRYKSFSINIINYAPDDSLKVKNTLTLEQDNNIKGYESDDSFPIFNSLEQFQNYIMIA